jgi:oligoendopeptidase F
MKRIALSLKITFIVVFSTFFSINGYGQKTREEVPDKYKWDLTDIYKSDADWRAAKDAIAVRLDEVTKFRGTLTSSAANLLKCMEFNTELSREAYKLFSYASMSSDLDTRDMKYTGMKQELEQMFSDFFAKAAFIEPEILTADWNLIDGFIKSEPGLAPYRIGLDNLFRIKKHTLSEPEERIMALSGMTGGVASSVYNTFSNAEMPNPEVVLSDGEKVVVTKAEYSKYRASANRADREIVFNAFWNNYAKFKASYGEMLYGNVKGHWFNAKARN